MAKNNDSLLKDKIEFIDALAVGLHTYGATAHHLEEAMTSVAKQLSVEAQFFSIPTAVYITYKTGGEYSTRLFRVNPCEAILKKLAEIDEVGDQVIDGKISAKEGVAALKAIEEAPPLYPKSLTSLSFGLAASGISCFLSGNWTSMLAAFAIGLIIGTLSQWGGRSSRIHRVFEIVAAFLATVVATLLNQWSPEVAVPMVVLASLIILIPGLSLTISVTELATQNLAAGTARLMGAVTTLLKLTFGVILAAKSMQLLGVTPLDLAFSPAPWWIQPLALVWTALSLSVFFQARHQEIPWVILSATIGYSITSLANPIFGPEMSVFFGGVVVSMGSNLFARYLKKPALIPLLPGIILLVPGSISYRSLQYLFEKNILLGLDTAASVTLILISLVTGVFLGNVIISPKRSF